MAHNYMMYTRTSSGVVARTHRTAQLEDVTSYTEEEKLGGWPEAFVFWQPMADGSAVGVAPESGAAFAALPQLATHRGQTEKARSNYRTFEASCASDAGYVQELMGRDRKDN